LPTNTATDTEIETSPSGREADYEIPFVHLRVPQRVGNTAFWLSAAAAVVGGVIELPVAAIVVGAVIVVRHRSSPS